MSFFSAHIEKLATNVLSAARAKKLKIATAESCTGGLIAAALTEIAGSSDVFDRSAICYSNDAKIEWLDVNADTIKEYGAVSAESAAEMADGLLDNSSADIVVTVTGIAGPGGGSKEKPVGLVYIAIANSDGVGQTFENHFKGDRSAVRMAAAEKALTLLLEEIENT